MICSSQLDAINWNGQHSTGYSSQQWDCDRSGSAVPHWRATIKAGGNATSVFVANYLNLRQRTPMIGRFTHIENAPGVKLYSEAIYGTISDGFPPFWDTDSTKADTLALTRVYKALKGAQTHANGLQFLGEFHEVISQLRHPFRAANALIDSYLDKAFRSFKRYRWREGSAAHRAKVKPSLERALAESWLETAFGLRPLISDVKEIAEAIARFQNDSRRDKISGSAELKTQGSDTHSESSTATSYVRFKRDVKNSMVHKVRYVAFLDWSRSADFGSVGRLADLLGFKPEQFVPSVYELVPWSFLVDYFTNLGTVIETGCAGQSAVKFAIRTTILESQVESLWSPCSSGALREVNSFVYPGKALLVRKRVSRDHYAQIPSVPLQFSLPGEPMKYINMLALWSGKIRSNT